MLLSCYCQISRSSGAPWISLCSSTSRTGQLIPACRSVSKTLCVWESVDPTPLATTDSSTGSDMSLNFVGSVLSWTPESYSCPCLSLRFRYTFELYLTSEKLFQFGLETADALHSWTKAIGKVRTFHSVHSSSFVMSCLIDVSLVVRLPLRSAVIVC